MNPKPLPPPGGTVINVSSAAQLASAISNLRSGQTILIARGRYPISQTGSDALYIPQNITNVRISGATGNRSDVVLVGDGMNGSVRFGFWLANVSGGTISSLTIDGVRASGIQMNGGVTNTLIHGVEMIDSGDQFIKSSPANGYGAGNDGNTVRFSILRYRTSESGAGETPNYTNGVDVHGGSNWVVEYNLFQNFRQPSGLAGPAVLFWNGSGGRGSNVVNGNAFINNDRDIAFGLVQQSAGRDSIGGVIANNTIYRPPGSGGDVAIGVMDSPNTQIINNTILMNGNYPNAIEYRFPTTSGVKIQNILTDSAITSRNGASGTVSNNLTSATPSLFADPAAGDLHLKSSAAAAIDHGISVPGILTDVDGQSRPHGAAPDLGADEYWTPPPPPSTPAKTTTAPASTTSPPLLTASATSAASPNATVVVSPKSTAAPTSGGIQESR